MVLGAMIMTGRMAALAAIAVILGMGFCLVGVDHATSADLCLSFLAATLQALLLFTLTLTGRLAPALARAYRRHPSDLPAPPPKA